MDSPAVGSPRPRPPRRVTMGGALFGAAASLIFLPCYSQRPLPLSGSFTDPWIFATFGSYEIALLHSVIFGALAAYGSWAWAVQLRHPVLSLCESWMPLRGRWLIIPCAVALVPLLWVTLWLLLGALFVLPAGMFVGLVLVR